MDEQNPDTLSELMPPSAQPSIPQSPGASEFLLIEYREASELFRHIYTNIWQSGSIFIASAFVVVAFLIQSGRIETPYTLIPMALIAFWWLGIFRPLNHYGDWRAMRAAQIEKLLGGSRPLSDHATPKLFRVPIDKIYESHERKSWEPRGLRVRSAVMLFVLLLEGMLAVPVLKWLLAALECLPAA